MPVGPSLRIEFGLDRDRLEGREGSARFQLSVATEGQPPETLMDVTVDAGDRKLWRRHTINLEQYELQPVTMCLSTSLEGTLEDGQLAAAWANPSIQSRRERLAQVDRRRVNISEPFSRSQGVEIWTCR